MLMKYWFSFLLFGVLFSLFSCEKKCSSELFVIGNPIKCEAKAIDVYEFADTVIYIQIDDSMLLPALGKDFLLADEYMFFLTKEGLLKYDRNGVLLKKIAKYGNGPGEFTRSYSMITMDMVNEHLYVYSYPNTILSYSFEGDFLGGVSVDLPCNAIVTNFYSQDDCFFFFFAHAWEVGVYPLYWIITDLDGKIKDTKRSDTKKKGVVSSTRYGGIFSSSCYNHGFISWDLLNDTVFHVDAFHEEAAFLWGKGDFRIVDTDDFSTIKVKRLLCSNFIDTKNFLLLRWRHIGEFSVLYTYYDKKEKKFYKTDDIFINKEVALSMTTRHFIYLQQNGREYILTQAKSRAVEDIPGAIKWGIDPDDLEGNPVLVLIRLKE